ncbi:MAG: lipopolysaccharide heptosyltransferase II [Gammaproteobacteria bacterium]
MGSSPRILVVGPAWVGDMVMAQSLFMTLKSKQPGCIIDVLAPAWTFSLLARMPEVGETVEMPLGHGKLGLMQRIELGKCLRSRRYDQAILLPNSWKSALTPFFAGIPLRTGYIGECRWGLLNDARRLDKKRLSMTVQRFVALAYSKRSELPPECPAPKLRIGKSDQRRVVEKFQLDTAGKILALCPGAEYGPAKRWPAGRYAEVAREKLGEGWRVWLFGSAKDKPINAAINRELEGACIDFSGLTSLAEAVDLMSLADAVVSNDSGLMHVAAALDKKLVAVYGSSDPNFTPPLNGHAKIVTLKLDCSPCFMRECPLGHTDCLNKISSEQVLNALDET